MTIYELSEGYAEAVDKINGKICSLKQEDNPDVFAINHLIKVRKDLVKIKEICRRYYERGVLH